jgi:3-deoxy-D-manno-octulosonic-acid transferase
VAGLLILVPRLPDRRAEIAAACAVRGLKCRLRSEGGLPDAETQVWIADSFGEMGLWYRLARAALIGGSFGTVEGHNPWEAIRLGVPVLHGPRTANFAADYAMLEAAGACRTVASAEALRVALSDPGLAPMADRASGVQRLADAGLAESRDRLLAMIGG